MPGMQTVNVTVANNQVAVDQPRLDLSGAGRNVQIQWIIQTSGWTFPSDADGVVISGNTGQFTGGHVAQQGTRYIWTDANSDSQEYKYTVKVTNGSTTLPLDPIIINGA